MRRLTYIAVLGILRTAAFIGLVEGLDRLIGGRPGSGRD
jgi:hypothetical protein